MSKKHQKLDSSDEEDDDYNPGEEQPSSRNSRESADSNAEAVYEPHSPEYLPPESPSEENSDEKVVSNKKRRIGSSDEEDTGPLSPDAPASPDQESIHSPDEESNNATPIDDEGEVEAQTEEIVADEPEKEGEEHDIMADIFGEDEEDQEFEGFKEVEEKKASSDESNDESEVRRPKLKVKFAPDKHRGVADESSKTSDEAGPSLGLGLGGESDFDRLMSKRREEQQRRRKRSRGMRSGAKIVSVAGLDAEEREAMEAGVDDIVQDADEIAVQLVSKMAKAAEEDRELAQKGNLAYKKLLLLPEAVDLISNVDFQPSMFDNGILGAITDWLLPLPDGSLPNIKIRTELLRIIQQFPPLNNDQLKDSGLGKAVMILCKHPKEIRANKTIARKLINEWARGIFNLSSQPNSEDREQQAVERLEEKRRRLSNSAGTSSEQPVAKRPGDPGWIYRARVPQLSRTDYVVRPEWKVTDAPKVARKEPISRYEKHARNLKDRAASGKKRYSAPSFIQFSLEGRKII